MDPNNNIAEVDYYNPMTTKSKREKRLLNSKRKLQEYLENVKSDPVYSFPKLKDKLNSKSVLNKLPEHDRSIYATPEMVRNGPTNKTIASINKYEAETGKSSNFGMKNLSLSNPVLDIQRKIVKDHEVNIEMLRSRRFDTVNPNDNKHKPRLIKEPNTINSNIIVSPTNPRPADFQNKISKLDVSGPIDKIGGITYRTNNPQSMYPVSVIKIKIYFILFYRWIV